MSLNILIIGCGGREHALAMAFDKSPQTKRVYVAPGNPGMTLNTTKVECVDIKETHLEDLADFAQDKQVDMTVVGPEHVLEAGIVDHFKMRDLVIVGPSQAAAMIESSKTFAKELMKKAGVRSANYHAFTPETAGKAGQYIKDLPYPIVIKEDGLAAGKGVYICQDISQANACLNELKKKGKKDFIIEDFLEGVEFSHFSLVNGTHIIPLGMARDYKRVFDDNKGPNTGGMGAYSPVTDQDEAYSDLIIQEVVKPVAQTMVDQGTPFTGILFTGLMMVGDLFYVIEFNARFGDPETQILLPRINEDIVDLFQAHLNKTDMSLTYRPGQSLGVILASKGYPKGVEDGKLIHIDSKVDLNQVIFAGVDKKDTDLISKGGRVMMVHSQSDSVDHCRQEVYDLISKIDIDQAIYRQDIGY